MLIQHKTRATQLFFTPSHHAHPRHTRQHTTNNRQPTLDNGQQTTDNRPPTTTKVCCWHSNSGNHPHRTNKSLIGVDAEWAPWSAQIILMWQKDVNTTFRRYIEHTLKGEEAQEARNQAFKAGFKIASADARVTMNDDETVKCTTREVMIAVREHFAIAIVQQGRRWRRRKPR